MFLLIWFNELMLFILLFLKKLFSNKYITQVLNKFDMKLIKLVFYIVKIQISTIKIYVLALIIY
jgi:hypothetical protein